MTWRLAHSLEVLRSELDQLAQHRSKASDGTIGDPAHAATASRHNPNAAGVVTAIDITQDAAGGCDIHGLLRPLIARYRAAYLAGVVTDADYVAHGLNPDFEYVISDRQIASRENQGWLWRAYTGADSHTSHAHFGVGRGPDGAPTAPYDDSTAWGFYPPARVAAAPSIPSQEDDMTFIHTPDAKIVLFAFGKLVHIGHPQGIDNDQNTWDLSGDPDTWHNVVTAFGPVIG